MKLPRWRKSVLSVLVGSSRWPMWVGRNRCMPHVVHRELRAVDMDIGVCTKCWHVVDGLEIHMSIARTRIRRRHK